MSLATDFKRVKELLQMLKMITRENDNLMSGSLHSLTKLEVSSMDAQSGACPLTGANWLKDVSDLLITVISASELSADGRGSSLQFWV